MCLFLPLCESIHILCLVCSTHCWNHLVCWIVLFFSAQSFLILSLRFFLLSSDQMLVADASGGKRILEYANFGSKQLFIPDLCSTYPDFIMYFPVSYFVVAFIFVKQLKVFLVSFVLVDSNKNFSITGSSLKPYLSQQIISPLAP